MKIMARSIFCPGNTFICGSQGAFFFKRSQTVSAGLVHPVTSSLLMGGDSFSNHPLMSSRVSHSCTSFFRLSLYGANSADFLICVTSPIFTTLHFATDTYTHMHTCHTRGCIFSSGPEQLFAITHISVCSLSPSLTECYSF